MAVKYVVVPKGNPVNPQAPKKFYSQVKTSGEIDLRELSTHIANISTLSSIDVMAVLEALLQIIPQHIADGKIVRLGDFGDFRLTLQSAGSETAGAVTAQNIKAPRLRFRPGKVFKKAMRNIEYKKAAT